MKILSFIVRIWLNNTTFLAGHSTHVEHSRHDLLYVCHQASRVSRSSGIPPDCCLSVFPPMINESEDGKYRTNDSNNYFVFNI